MKNNQELLPEEKLKLSVHCTQSGLSQDSTFLQDIEVSKEFTLPDLKETLMDLPTMIAMTEGLTPDHVRVRSKIHSGFFGPILRGNSNPSKSDSKEKTLKQL